MAALLAACAPASGPGSSTAAPAADVAGLPENAASPPRVRLMTAGQYANTIASIFGDDIAVVSPFAPLRRTDGLLASGAAAAGVTSGQLQQFQRAAVSIAAQVVEPENLDLGIPGRRNFLVPCRPASETAADDACAARFLASTGRLLYRRPLSQERLALLVADAGTAAAQLNDFYAGLARTLEGMLISPEVLFIADTSEPDPAHPGRRRLTDDALASRLSFFLWNAAPDDTLLRAAESGTLRTGKGLVREVDRMLASTRLEAGVRAFFDDMFAFDDFNTLAKDPDAYPTATAAALADAREQTLRTVIDHLLTRKADYRDLFTTRRTFMSPALAAAYQVPTLPGWAPYEFPEGSPRIGIMTHISFLAVHAHPARSSPTLRGKALRELLLCQRVPPPPPNVDFSALEDPKAEHRTQRDRVNFHLQNPVCAGCHKITDPMGLALENFDGAGLYRAQERGVAIDASGGLDGKTFMDVTGLALAVRDHPALSSCLVRRLYSYGTGGPVSRAEQPVLNAFTAHFEEAGHRLPDLLRAIVLSPVFSRVTESPAAAQTASAN